MAIAFLAAPLCVSAAAQVKGTCAAPFSVPLDNGSALSIEARSSEVEIVGGDAGTVRVSCRLDRSDEAGDVQLSFSSSRNASQLRVTGGPTNNVHVHIEVPQRTDLRLRMLAGAVRVRQVTGNKDLELTAGEIRVSPVLPADYSSVDATVRIGDLQVPSMGVNKGGFFRTVSKENAPGQYKLRAHITTGSIRLE